MGRTAKLTVSVPRELITLAGKIARERKISRSQVVSSCLQELARKQLEAEMEEGYMAMSKEQKEFADMAAKIENEILPEWK